jgi:hypothetical protein
MPSKPSVAGIKFLVPATSTKKKYKAILPNGKSVMFGARDYQQYKDSVPEAQGGGKWSHLDHKDEKRLKNYQARHGGVLTKEGKKAISVKYSPAWFSYYFLW